ncbi:MAG: TonB-dependent receptor plug domain-containing protein [Bacteroidota bacterium]
MKQTPLLLLLLAALIGVHPMFAQTDSLYAQQWNRDPVLSLSHTASAQRQIITSKQIQASGYTRLSDLLQLIDGWTFTTRAAEAWRMQSNGTGSYNNQNWILMLNGQRIEYNRYEAIDINKLGISVADVERIEVVNSSGMYLGEFAQNGLIQIVTKKNSEGISSRTYYGQMYIPDNPRTLENQFGSVIYQTLGYTRKKFHIHASTGTNSIKSGLHTQLEVQHSGNKIMHQLQAGLSAINAYTPENKYKRIGYLGLWTISPGHQIRLSSTYIRGEDYIRTNNQVTNTLQHRFFKAYKSGNFIWQNGVGIDYLHTLVNLVHLRSFYPHSESSAWILKPYSSLNIPINRKLNLFTDVQLAFANQKVAPKLSAGFNKRVSFISNYSFVFSYNEHLLEEFFLNTINQQIGVLEGAPYFYNPKQITADFYYNINFGNSVKLSYNSGLKNTFDLPDYRYSIETYSFRTYLQSSVKRATHQFNWINRVNLHYDILKNMVMDINYMRTEMINSWDANLQDMPKHKFTVTMQYDLPKRYSLWTRNYWQSETKWYNYTRYFQSNPYDLYITLPSIYTWDLGISKKLYKDYLNLNITARNLFNSNERYHPIGAQFDIRFSASITANIDGLFASRAAKP